MKGARHRCQLKQSVIQYTIWIGSLVYTVAMVAFYLVITVAFPGYTDIDKYINWEVAVYGPYSQATTLLWLAMTVISTVVTIVAIWRLSSTVKWLANQNTNLDLNLSILVVHCIVLAL